MCKIGFGEALYSSRLSGVHIPVSFLTTYSDNHHTNFGLAF